MRNRTVTESPTVARPGSGVISKLWRFQSGAWAAAGAAAAASPIARYVPLTSHLSLLTSHRPSPRQRPFPPAEEREEPLAIGLARVQAEQVGAALLDRARELGVEPGDLGPHRIPHARTGCIHPAPGAGLRVLKRHRPHVGQLPLARVYQLHGDDVVTPGEPAEHGAPAVGEEVGDEEEHRAAPEQRLQGEQAAGQVGAAPGRLVPEQLADDAQHLAPALAWQHVALQPVGEERGPDPVVVPGGGEGEHGADLDREGALGPAPRAEGAGRAVVHGEKDGELALLEEALDVGRAQARGDVPVDHADVVARLVLAYLGELHAAAPEGARVFAGDDVADQMSGRDLDPPDLGGDFLGTHG